jgi:hypothetical protein
MVADGAWLHQSFEVDIRRSSTITPGCHGLPLNVLLSQLITTFGFKRIFWKGLGTMPIFIVLNQAFPFALSLFFLQHLQ